MKTDLKPAFKKENIGLYIHIPFCKSKCIYCDFCSFANQEGLFDTYVEMLKREMDIYSSKKADKYCVSTLFVGGGTPSLLGGKRISQVIKHATTCFDFVPNAEITVEANPDSLDESFAKEISIAGANRISIGLQSASDRLLFNLGRPHLFEDFKQAFKISQKYFNNINVDLMLGISGQTLSDVKQTLDTVVEFAPQHLSLYALILERGTPLNRLVKSGKTTLPTTDETTDMYDYAVQYLAQQKYARYEVSNFAKDGYECRHNLNYWDRGNYLGIGLSAHGFCEGVRYANYKSIDKYIAKTSQNKLPISSKKKVDILDACFEFVFLNLRKTKGFCLQEFFNNTGKDFFEVYGKLFDELMVKGLLKEEHGRVFIPQEYFYVMNDILSEFVP